MLFDTHCHLDHPLLLDRIQEVLSGAAAAGVNRFLVPGVAREGWERIRALSIRFPQVLPAYGVHPMHAEQCDTDALDALLGMAPHAAAIGEIGLDYAISVPRSLQLEAFRAQLRLAVASRLPVLIHCRKAFPDLLRLLQEEKVQETGGVLHAFSGSAEIAQDCLKLGLHISLGGSVTYPNAVRPPAVARSVPLERLMLETDAPDLPPQPHRGEVNLPEYLVCTAQTVASLRGMSVAELASATTDNACRLFQIKTK